MRIFAGESDAQRSSRRFHQNILYVFQFLFEILSFSFSVDVVSCIGFRIRSLTLSSSRRLSQIFQSHRSRSEKVRVVVSCMKKFVSRFVETVEQRISTSVTVLLPSYVTRVSSRIKNHDIY